MHQITRRKNELEERVQLISTYLFTKDEENADDLQVDAVGHTVPDASDVDSTDSDHDKMFMIETPDQGVPELNNDTTNEQHAFPVAGNRMQLMGLFGKITGRENIRSHIVNTETLHMYTLSVTRKCATFPTLKGRVWSLVMSSISPLLVCSQMILLLSLLFEGGIPTCTSHIYCFGGLFCEANMFSDESIQPQCADCQQLIDLNVIDKNLCTEMMPGWQYFEEIDENVIWFD